jgi:hypothetical protein
MASHPGMAQAGVTSPFHSLTCQRGFERYGLIASVVVSRGLKVLPAQPYELGPLRIVHKCSSRDRETIHVLSDQKCGSGSSLSELRLGTNPNSVEARGSLRPPAPAPLRGEPAKRHKSRLHQMHALAAPARLLPQPHRTSM